MLVRGQQVSLVAVQRIDGLLELVALDHLVMGDNLVRHFRDALLFQPPPLLVQQV